MDDWTMDSQDCIRDVARLVPLDEIGDAAEIARLDARDTVYSLLWASYADVCYA